MKIRNRFPTVSVEIIRIGKQLRRLSSIFLQGIRKDKEMNKEKMININASLVEEPVFNSFKKRWRRGKDAKLLFKKDRSFLF